MRTDEETLSKDDLERICQSADEMKKAGNEAMKAGSYDEAHTRYTDGIQALSGSYEHCRLLSSQLFSNRAAVEIAMKRPQGAVDDCARAIEIDPSNLKAYWRAAKASLQLEEFAQAVKFCDDGLKIDATNADILELKHHAERTLKRTNRNTRGFTQEDAISCQNLVKQLQEQMYLINQKIQAHEFEAARNARTTHLINQTPESSPLYSSVGRGFLRVSREDIIKNLNERAIQIKDTELPDYLATREAISKRLQDAENELNEMVEYFQNRSQK